jgi:hypothetical protein
MQEGARYSDNQVFPDHAPGGSELENVLHAAAMLDECPLDIGNFEQINDERSRIYRLGGWYVANIDHLLAVPGKTDDDWHYLIAPETHIIDFPGLPDAQKARVFDLQDIVMNQRGSFTGHLELPFSATRQHGQSPALARHVHAMLTLSGHTVKGE